MLRQSATRYVTASRHHHGSLFSMLVVACLLLCGLVWPPCAGAAGLGVKAFYTTTLGAYNHWTGAQAPPEVTTFPAGTTAVAYYFAYSGATPLGTTFSVIEHMPDGTRIVEPPRFLDQVGGAFMAYFQSDSGYVPGVYRLDLVATDGSTANALLNRVSASISFTIGSGASASAFFTISRTSFERLLHVQGYTPSPSGAFPAHSVDVGYYFRYLGAVPGHTQAQVALYNLRGATLFRESPHALSAVDGQYFNAFAYRGGWPAGAYRLNLFLDGKLSGTTLFTVQ